MPVRLALLAVLFASSFGTQWVASLHYPGGYDWRTRTMSDLYSPLDNPGWCWLASAGVVVSGVCMLALVTWMEGELAGGERTLSRRVRRPAFLVGIVSMMLASVVPEAPYAFMGGRHARGILEAHRFLAQTSALWLWVGMVCACRSATLGNGGAGARGKRLRALRIAWRVTASAVIVGLAGNRLLAHLARSRGSVLLCPGFTEWLGFAAVFLFFAGSLLFPDRRAVFSG